VLDRFEERSAIDAELCARSAEYVVSWLQLIRRVNGQLDSLTARHREVCEANK
jgi:hypothetical protein